MANLPDWAVAALAEAGVSLEGWNEVGRTVVLTLDDLDTWIWVCNDGTVEVEIKDIEKPLHNSFRIADRIKRAINDEPDPRVAELQEALRLLLPHAERMSALDTVEYGKTDWMEVHIQQAKAALAKAKGESE